MPDGRSCVLTLSMLLFAGPVWSQSSPDLTIWVRGVRGMHLAGFEVQSRLVPWIGYRNRLEAHFGAGASVDVMLGESPWSVRLDWDYLRRAELEESSPPQLLRRSTGPLWWLTGSLSYRPGWLCESTCVTGSLGIGTSRFSWEYDILLDDIIASYVNVQSPLTFRIGLDVSLSRIVPGLGLQLADYVSLVTVENLDHDVSPLHVMVVGVGWGWSPGGG